MKKILIYIILLLSIFLLSVPVWANEKLVICNKYEADCTLTKKDVTAIMTAQDYFEYMNQCKSETVKISNEDDINSNSYIIYGECKEHKFVDLLSVSKITTKFEEFMSFIIIFSVIVLSIIIIINIIKAICESVSK